MHRVDLIDNGQFDQDLHPLGDGVPWWRTRAGEPQIEEGGCRLGLGDVLEQPLAAYGPLLDQLVVRGDVTGEGVLEIVGEDGGLRARRSVRGPFELTFAPGELGSPRLLLRIGAEPTAAGPESAVLWRSVEALVALPAPTSEQLQSEARAHLERIHGLWLERARDDIGPRATGFLAFSLNAETGERSAPLKRAGMHSFWAQLLAAYALEPAGANAQQDTRERALEEFTRDLIELGLNAQTGLPQLWDPAADAPDLERPVEIASVLDFLLDAAEYGPPAQRARARSAALRMGRTVLAHGRRPDGTVAASYRPRDAAPAPLDAVLRQLDVPAQLVRLGALGTDPEGLDAAWLAAARDALWTLEFKHVWPAAWGKIDPGFDDLYGHLGARARVMWSAAPEEPAFRRLAISGLETYLPSLAELVRYGGYVAADQVRCWRIFVDIAELEPRWSARLAPTLLAAARQHFKGGQGDQGFWLDVTMDRWGPVSNLPVGDLLGLPQNLLEGLALLLRPESGLSASERTDVRAMFCAVLRSSDQAYGRSFGHVMSPRTTGGFPSAEGSLRLAAGLVGFLDALSDRGSD